MADKPEMTPTPFSPQELALIMTMAFTTMELVHQHPDKLEEMLDPENGLTMDLFETVLGKLAILRTVAQVAQALQDTGDDDDPNDLASMKPAGNA
jgi:predicted DNA-binding ArsR family transcriptional regulator